MATDRGLVVNNWLKAIRADQKQAFQPALTAQDKQVHQKLDAAALTCLAADGRAIRRRSPTVTAAPI
ncbi:MAG TPA: hypothetical protein VNV18_03405 [Stellaceae bacterium]|jgi:hypothetical protein|nr:hypothetical protein [Stellaceae bacterium]